MPVVRIRRGVRRGTWRLVFAAAACLVGCVATAGRPSSGPSPRTPVRRVVLLSVDANANWILDRLIAEGGAPAFARMAREGARAQGLVGAMPSLTAVSHATLWTGAWSRQHGVAGNSVVRLPKASHTLLDVENGFDSGPLVAEPIWDAAARAGKRVFVVQATGGYPFKGRYPDRVTQFDVYATRLLTEAIIAGDVATAPYRFTAGATAFTVSADGDRLRLESDGGRWTLTPGLDGRFSEPVPVRVEDRDARVRFRLLSFDRTSGRFRLFRGVANVIHGSPEAKVAPFVASAGALVGESVGDEYRRGDFGPTLAAGGNGDAERWLLDVLSANQEYFEGALAFAAGESWDLLVSYVPNLDATLHALAGMLEPASEAWSPEREREVWPFVRAAFERLVNGYVTEIRQRLPDATLVIAADHGMEGASRYILPNVALRKAGLLAFDASGRIDLSRTKALFMQGRGMMIFVNTTEWKGGIVPPAEKASVKRAAAAALLAIPHPFSTGPVVRAVYDVDVDGPGLGIGGERGGDLYFDPAPGFYTSDRERGEAETISAGPTGDGIHGVAPWRWRMHGAFYAAGPGVAPGRALGFVPGIDVAPTVAALLGIAPPANAIGRAQPLQ